MINDVMYVTQEMWDRAQAALRAALPVIEQHTPPLSTAGTMVSLRDQVRAAIMGSAVEPKAPHELSTVELLKRARPDSGRDRAASVGRST